MRNFFKALLVVLSLAAGYEHYLERVAQLSTSSVWLVAVYLGLLALLSLALLAAAFVRPPLLRWLYAVLFAGAATFWDTNLRVTGQFPTYDAFVSQIDAFSFVNEALSHYWQSIVAAAVPALLLLLGIGLRPGAPRRRGSAGEGADRAAAAGRSAFRSQASATLAAAAPAIALLLLTVILFARGGDGGRGLPSMFMSLAYLNLFAYEGLMQSVGPRESVRLPHSGSPPSHDLVLIVDESVSGNYLDINTPNGIPTPLSHPPASVRVHNFGYAASITNCSAGVNYTLRFGGTRDDYVRINARMPSIWQYAKAAGLETVFIDAQRTGGMLINRMNKRELADIDRWLQFDDVPVRDRDMAAAERLAALFADGAPQFIYVNKMGAHFPIHDKAPDEFVRYHPALPRGSYEDVPDTGLRFGIGDTAADWVLYRNSYRNTLLWSVGEFFNRLFRSGQLDHAVIVYTSDHGQDLHERGNPGLNTHCGQSPVMEEGLVPLVVVQGAGVRTLDWTAHLEDNRNHSSHFNIFPTLLQLMGYAPDAVQAVYGRALTVPTKDPFTFNSRFNARLGRPPKWEFIDLSRIVTPPADKASTDEAEPANGPADNQPRKKAKT
jgi:lipid A ethanolaminephosphotransferase